MLREFRLLFPYVRRYRWIYALGALCILGSIALKLLIPYTLGASVDELRALAAGPDGEGDPAQIAELVAIGALSIAGLAIATALVRTASRLLLLGVARRAVYDLRRSLFARLLELPPSFYVRNQTGNVMSRCVNDIQNVQGLTGPVFMYLAETAVLYVIALAVMGRISPSLTALAFSPFPLFIYIARRQAAQIQHGSRAAQEMLADLSTRVDESLSGHVVVKTLTLEDFDLERFRTACDRYRNQNLVVTRARSNLMPVMLGLASLSIGILLVVGGPRVVRGDISLGSFITIILYLQMLSAPTGVLGFVISSVQRGAAALGRIREIFEAEVTLPELPAAAAANGPAAAASGPAAAASGPAAAASGNGAVLERGDVSIRRLTIRQPPRSTVLSTGRVTDTEADASSEPMPARTVLHDVSLEVPAGTTLGIVGRTGAGKTTLVNVLARQLEVEPGHLFFDGKDALELPLPLLRRSIGLVPQEAFLFGASIEENVALGRPDATRAEVEEAIRIARLDKDVPQLPDGLETMLGERGINLSGGQRQRAALARAVLLDPKVLLLDDALSAVDAETADEILAALRPVMESRTTIIVSHRISAIQWADNIAVLEEGRLKEQGTHDQLVARNGIYAALHREQKRREELAADLGLADVREATDAEGAP